MKEDKSELKLDCIKLKIILKVDIDSRLGKSVVITKNTPQVNSDF